MIHAASRQALAELRERLDGVLNRFSTADGLTGLADELHAVVDVLIEQPQLRRKLADPTTKAERRAGLVRSLFVEDRERHFENLKAFATPEILGGEWTDADAPAARQPAPIAST